MWQKYLQLSSIGSFSRPHTLYVFKAMLNPVMSHIKTPVAATLPMVFVMPFSHISASPPINTKRALAHSPVTNSPSEPGADLIDQGRGIPCLHFTGLRVYSRAAHRHPASLPSRVRRLFPDSLFLPRGQELVREPCALGLLPILALAGGLAAHPGSVVCAGALPAPTSWAVEDVQVALTSAWRHCVQSDGHTGRLTGKGQAAPRTLALSCIFSSSSKVLRLWELLKWENISPENGSETQRSLIIVANYSCYYRVINFNIKFQEPDSWL